MFAPYHEERFPDDYGFEGKEKPFPRELLDGLAHVEQFYMAGFEQKPTIELTIVGKRIAIEYTSATWHWYNASTWGFDSCDFRVHDKLMLVERIEAAINKYLNGMAIGKEFVASPQGKALKAAIRGNSTVLEWDANLFYGVEVEAFSYVNMSKKLHSLTGLNEVLKIEPLMDKWFQDKIAEAKAKEDRESAINSLRKAGKPIPKHLR